ncbi:MAG: glycoside hydrolase family protein [Acidobacteria bacterium]|nr:glycoside hydrolase family protein [Acidobacteriota bacterium]
MIAEYSGEVAAAPRVSYLTTDHLGSPRVTTNASGEVISRRDFQPYGEEVFSVERTTALGYTAADSVRQKFTGYERDIESGLDFAQARYYNSSHGRFTSVDPLTASATIRNPQTFNRYSYGLNSPYKFTDPLGLSINLVGCDFECRVTNAINGIGKLSAADLALAKYHVANGTALGYVFLNASYNQLRPQTQTSTNTNAGGNDSLSMSAAGRQMLASLEDKRYTPYDKDQNGGAKNCTVGIGHLLHSGKCSSSVADTRQYSDEEIGEFLEEDLKEAEARVKNAITTTLEQSEFDALTMLAFNLSSFGLGGKKEGAPKLVAALNAGREMTGEYIGRWKAIFNTVPGAWHEPQAIRTEWSGIKYSGRKLQPGLVNRRKKELTLFFEGTYSN